MHNFILKELNKSFEAYLVGGCVRDLLMNRKIKDYDIVTSAKPDEIKDIFKNEKISEVGESFKVMIVNGIEVATFRKDRYFGLSDKNVEIEYADTLEEDLERRDLTINSMALYKDKIIDPFDGQKDIRLRQIKFTGNPDSRIYDDPCRILRAIRFCCLFYDTYNIDKDSYFSLKRNANLISYIKPERIRLEILKVMEYRNPSLFFNLLKEFDILTKIFPSLDLGYYHFDNNYHNETVFLHNMIVGDNISRKRPLLRLAGYLHDIGKPVAYNGQNYKEHDNIGSEIVKKELKELKFNSFEIEYISNLIDMHMLHLKELSPRGIRRLFVKLHEKNIKWKDLIQLRIADRSGNLKNENYSRQEIKECVLSIYKELNKKPSFSVKDLAINGHGVMKMLDLKPGPKVGKVLKDLFNKVIEDPELNTIEQLCSIIEFNYKKYKEGNYEL